MSTVYYIFLFGKDLLKDGSFDKKGLMILFSQDYCCQMRAART